MSAMTVGMDLVDVGDFGALLAEPGTSFADRVFTPGELAAADLLQAGRRDRHLAGRFAAKEALVKAWSAALPTGAPVLPQTRTWAGIEVRADAFGRPSIVLHEPVATAVEQSLGRVRAQVSISHERAMAGAVVILQLLTDEEES